MASPYVTKINEASKEAWPLVSSSVAITMRTAQELAEIAGAATPAVEAYFAKPDSQRARLRKVCEETVWVLAQLGWLRTGGERDVILAAKAWFDVSPDEADPAVLDKVDGDLSDAVSALPEYLDPKEK